MAYSTALEEEEEAGWQCCMPPRGSFGVLSRAQGAAEGVRSRDNPPPQPRPVEAHLQAAMRSPLGAPGARWNGERAPMGCGAEPREERRGRRQESNERHPTRKTQPHF